jgi:hypothetical protein
MPEVRDVYADTEALELPDLHRRRDEITASAPDGDYSKLSDDALCELLAVNRALRKKTAANAGVARRATAAPRAKKPPLTVTDIL